MSTHGIVATLLEVCLRERLGGPAPCRALLGRWGAAVGDGVGGLLERRACVRRPAGVLLMFHGTHARSAVIEARGARLVGARRSSHVGERD